ncbi:MAG TPA: M28 family peptidase [Vicinamibacterales bacterium]|nr:M28 family peptidase [Vicinamibacterales bacterium]
MHRRRLFTLLVAALCCGLSLNAAGPLAPQSTTTTAGGAASITPDELKGWLSYIASDELEGRQVFTEGLGLAAGYIADHLKEWGVKPAGDDGTYFQEVKVLGVDATSRSSVTVTVNGRTKTFKDGEGVTFPENQGGKQTLTLKGVEFVGYGLSVPGHDDLAGRDLEGKAVVYLGACGPAGDTPRRLIAGRSRSAIELGHAAAVFGPPRAGRGDCDGTAPRANTPPARPVEGRGNPAAAGRGQQPAAAPARSFGRGGTLGDFTTVQRLDTKTPPQITASDAFFEFLFSGADQAYTALKAKADERGALPAFSLKNASITINIDADYKVVQTRLTRNVVGIIEGSDPALKDTYVLFGAHYDHIGYRQTPVTAGRGGFGGGRERPTPRPGDIVNNGADDDGSGTVALMGIARAFALGPKPKRSLMFVWHAGEEAGLYGSRYMADYPEVPLDKVSAQLNIDMIGRNRDDKASESNTVYVVGSDRISTELHNVNEDANASLSKPMTLDYEFNDPADPESIYTRSDHYSYASKGIPIIFYTTGLHPDYHWLTDEVSKIEFPKLAHIAQLVYTTGTRVANLDHFPARDNKGPRMGKGETGKIGS